MKPINRTPIVTRITSCRSTDVILVVRDHRFSFSVAEITNYYGGPRIFFRLVQQKFGVDNVAWTYDLDLHCHILRVY